MEAVVREKVEEVNGRVVEEDVFQVQQKREEYCSTLLPPLIHDHSHRQNQNSKQKSIVLKVNILKKKEKVKTSLKRE